MLRKKDRVAIDIDCTLTELMDPTIHRMASYFGKPVPKIDQMTDYNLAAAFGITVEESLEFWNSMEELLVKESVLSEDRYESIYRNWVGSNTEVYMVTNRPIKYHKQTKEWLDVHNIRYDGLIMTGGLTKAVALRDKKIELIVDDNPSVFLDIAKYALDTTTVCVDYPYNYNVVTDLRMDLGGNIIHARNRNVE